MASNDKNKDNSSPSKPSDQEGTQPTGSTPTTEPKAGGFTFSRVKEVPNGTKSGGKSKYDWDSFPAPDPKEGFAETFIENVTPKPIYTSIRKYRARLKTEGKPDREFTVRTQKGDVPGKPKGVWVYRTK